MDGEPMDWAWQALQFQRQMDKLMEPQRQLQDYIRQYAEPYRLLQEQVRAQAEEYQHQFQKFLAPQRQLQEQIAKYLAPQHQLEEQMQKLFSPQRILQEQASQYLQSLGDYFSDPLIAAVGVDQAGYLSIGDETLSVETIQGHVMELTAQAQAGVLFFEAFFEWLQKLAPAVRAVMLVLIFPFFVAIVANLATPICEEWWKNFRDTEPRVAKKEIVNLAAQTYNSNELQGFRFVAARALTVRESNNQQAGVLDELYLGKTVKLLKRDKQWSLVEYFDDETDSHKQGWVLSRYIGKFEK